MARLRCNPLRNSRCARLAPVRNDLAIAQHKAGDDAACLSTLEPLAEYRDAPPGEPIGYEPSFEDVFARIAKATRTNAKLCGFVAKK